MRTATEEADRREAARTAVAEPCTLTFGADPARIAGTLRDLSHNGAAISASGRAAGSDEQGTITLDRHGGARARFDVRAVDHEGTMHVSFNSKDPAFELVLQTLLTPPREARRA
ncbi:MAG TPA: PilZ domain-containing protein [Acetobacteraceae bacterium]